MNLHELQERVKGLTGDARHEAIVDALPGGLTFEQFRWLTLISADADGIVDPPSVDHGMWMGLILKLFIEGVICRVNHGYHTPFAPFRITDAGRAALVASSSTPARDE